MPRPGQHRTDRGEHPPSSRRARPFSLHARDPVGVLAEDGIATLGRHLAQIMYLCLRVLIDGGDAQVERGALQARLLFCRFGVADSNLPTYCWMNSIRTVVISTPCAAVAALKALCKLTSTLMFTLFTPVSSFFLIGLTSFPGDEFMRV